MRGNIREKGISFSTKTHKDQVLGATEGRTDRSTPGNPPKSDRPKSLHQIFSEEQAKKGEKDLAVLIQEQGRDGKTKYTPIKKTR